MAQGHRVSLGADVPELVECWVGVSAASSGAGVSASSAYFDKVFSVGM